MIFRRRPFDKSSDNDLWYKHIKNDRANNFWKAHSYDEGIKPKDISIRCKQLIFGMLCKEPWLRPSINEVMNLPWI